MYSNVGKKEKRKMKMAVLERMGLEISLKQKIHELSGGEQQKGCYRKNSIKTF